MFGSEHVVIGEEVVEAEVFDRPANTRPTAFGSPRSSFNG